MRWPLTQPFPAEIARKFLLVVGRQHLRLRPFQGHPSMESNQALPH